MTIKKITSILFAFVLIFANTNVNAADIREEKSGDKLFLFFDFASAVKEYEKALKRAPENTIIKEKIATSYRLMNNPIEMERWYGEVVKDPKAAPINKYYYAQSLRSNEKYDQAIKYYNEFKTVSKDPRPLDIIDGYQYIKKLSKGDPTVKLVNIVEANSAESDYSPMFYRDTAIVFVTNAKGKVKFKDDWTGMNFHDLYLSGKEKGKHKKPTPFVNTKVNGDYHEGPLTFSKDYGVMYITRSNYNKDNKLTKATDKKTVTLKIYKLNYEGSLNNWVTPEEACPFNSNEYSVSHPALSVDDKYMYFASDMPGGYGGTDIWRAKKEGAAWGKPENLGPTINTPGEEKFPFIAKDSSLYYASDGHYGLGGLDIYKVKFDKKKKKWDKSNNLGAPFNSSKDDFGYISDKTGQKGYLTSNRPGGLGSDDIYSWSNTALKLYVNIKDSKTGEPLGVAECKLICKEEFKGGKKTNADGVAEYIVMPETKCTLKVVKQGYKAKSFAVSIGKESKTMEIKMEKEGTPEMKLEILVLDKNTNQPISGAVVKVDSKNTPEKVNSKTDQEGKILMAGIQGNNEYYISADKATGDPNKKYLTVKQTVSTVGKQAPAYLKEVIYLELVEKNVAIKIENIYYDIDKYYIRPDAARELDKLVKVLADNPTIEIELSSHTDCRSSYQYNMQLSSKRAESAVNYLATKGIDSRRMIAAGYGESRLVNDCACEMPKQSTCTDAQHQENRRTEFKILKF
jgi:outer membrane protein OmpA-like peptidoglycan-associated protein